MTDRDKLLIEAIRRDGLGITPCEGRKFAESYTEIEGQLMFWYNIPRGTTRTIMAARATQIGKDVISNS